MGITGLQTYILGKTTISQYCDYGEEIEKWRIEHGRDPTILIDLKEFANIISRVFVKTVPKGGVFDKYIEMATFFFDQLKNCNVNLVFFVREALLEDIDKRRKELIKEAVSSTNVLQCNNRHVFYDMIKLSQEYGELIITTTAKIHVIVSYANDHADDVLAVIGDDTHFLAFNGKFQYWPLTACPGLRGLRFDRNTLLAETGLSNEQLRLLATLSDVFENWFHFPKNQSRTSLATRLQLVIEYVKDDRLMRENAFDWKTIASDVYGENYTPEQLEDFEIRYNKFDTEYRPTADQENSYRIDLNTLLNEIIDFCKENNVFIYYEIVGCDKRLVWLKDLCCLDRYNAGSIDFIDVLFTVLARLPGVFFKNGVFNKRPETIQFHNRHLPYPLELRTNLKQFIVDQKNRSNDMERWELLEWVLGLDREFLEYARRVVPHSIRQRLMTTTMHFLLARSLIATESAKCIVRIDVIVRSNHLGPAPGNSVRLPRDVNTELVEEARNYGTAYWLVCQALKYCELQSEVDLIQFNAFHFYEAIARPRPRWRTPLNEYILFPPKRYV